MSGMWRGITGLTICCLLLLIHCSAQAGKRGGDLTGKHFTLNRDAALCALCARKLSWFCVCACHDMFLGLGTKCLLELKHHITELSVIVYASHNA